ncbi:protein phosphatase 2c [Stylonychia lemnae]|uniref:Protein phosphatase 2c n=1 Tax=Stylonychia lemnae TaxID=5949 RepID=A0A077ZWC3_STYLE|nr:protein phosphatase 2c [Stylonychia lemnae]|eukprot:CDW73886.1 protein phosphatase 2c [Stylonychia lemnae]
MNANLDQDLSIDLSESQMKISETFSIPLSTRNALSKSNIPQQISLLDCNVDKISYGVSLKKGNFRQTQEDRFLVEENFKGKSSSALFAIFDGHSGQRAAEYCQANLSSYLKMNKNLDRDICQTLREALIIDNKLTVSNVGDSSAIIIRSDRMLELTSEQTPLRIDEYQRIQERGGYIVPVGQTLRVQGVLAVTRSIGDINYKDLIIPEPEISTISLSPSDQYLILSSDGLYRTYGKQKIAQYVIELRRLGWSMGKITNILSQRAVEDGCPDNITIIIVDLQYYYNKFQGDNYIQDQEYLVQQRSMQKENFSNNIPDSKTQYNQEEEFLMPKAKRSSKTVLTEKQQLLLANQNSNTTQPQSEQRQISQLIILNECEIEESTMQIDLNEIGPEDPIQRQEQTFLCGKEKETVKSDQPLEALCLAFISGQQQ